MTFFRSAPVERCARAALRAVAIGSLAATLGGCYSTRDVTAEYPFDYRNRHPISLREGEQTVEVFVSRNRGGLNPAQRADVLAFAVAWRREGNSGIIIDAPIGPGKSPAVQDSLREIHSIFAASGVPRQAVRVRAYRPASLAVASIKLNYGKLIASAGPCGLWPYDMGPSDDASYQENRPYWNFGCANQHNLAAMVDNPADLVQPRGDAPAYQARRSVGLEKYRKGENPGGTYTGYDAAKISDLGK